MMSRESAIFFPSSVMYGSFPFGALGGTASATRYATPAIRRYVSTLLQNGLRFGMSQTRAN